MKYNLTLPTCFILCLAFWIFVIIHITGCATGMDTFKGTRHNIQGNPKFAKGDTVQKKRHPEMKYIINQPMISHSAGNVGVFYSAWRVGGGMSYWLPEYSYRHVNNKRLER